MQALSYHGYRFPPAIIQHAVWLYLRFIEAEQGISKAGNSRLRKTMIPMPAIASRPKISHAVWLYHVFSLSLRDVERLLAEQGIVVSYETVRRWCKNSARLSLPQATAARQVAHGRCVTNTFPKLEMWRCMRDEGRPLDAGSQVQASNHCKLLSSKAMVVSVAAKGGT
jgi:hypothetical protein